MRKITSSPSAFDRIFSNKVLLVFWVIGCIVLGLRLIRSGLGTKQAFMAKEQAENRLKQEENKGLELIQKLDDSNSTLEQERRIRDELNMQKPGEIILQFPSPSP